MKRTDDKSEELLAAFIGWRNAALTILAAADGLGDGLRTDAQHSLAAWARFAARPPLWEAWGHLLHSVRTGENAFRHAHGSGVGVSRQAS
jgi:hypothetical protein